mgnify:CR=1 FL=1
MNEEHLFIGIMSGTSIDAVDAVAVQFKAEGIRVVDSVSEPIPCSLKQQILDLCDPNRDSVHLLGETDHQLGRLYAKASLTLLKKSQLSASQISAIGCHGQTIRHVTPSESSVPFSLQIGDANIIAAQTGIAVVTDFRRKDMALGGQGAPLVPAFHEYCFAKQGVSRVIVNIGGISNITSLPANGVCTGFDTGPGNILMDLWAQIHLGTHYDDNGDWAARGSVNQDLLAKMKCCEFFSQPAPKSTGRELFNLQWLTAQMEGSTDISPEDVQATLLALTADTIFGEIQALNGPLEEVYICGGGAYNVQLMAKLSELMPQVNTTEALGMSPSLVEGCAFAWLAKRRLASSTGNLSAVTGAKKEAVLGALYHP